MLTANGKCLCGTIEFTVKLPSKWVAHCHCTLCQREHGAAFVTWAGFVESEVTIFDSTQALTWYPSTAEAERGFCGVCGSSLFFRSAKWPEEIHIVRANFIDNLDREPQAHVYYDTHVQWFDVKDTLPKKNSPA